MGLLNWRPWENVRGKVIVYCLKFLIISPTVFLALSINVFHFVQEKRRRLAPSSYFRGRQWGQSDGVFAHLERSLSRNPFSESVNHWKQSLSALDAIWTGASRQSASIWSASWPVGVSGVSHDSILCVKRV